MVGMDPAVDTSKLRRGQKRYFDEIDNIPVELRGGLFYDSRKDFTITRKKLELKTNDSNVIEPCPNRNITV